MQKLIALSQLKGSYGLVQAGQEFETDDDTARELLRLGYVKHAADPHIAYETQAIVPEEAPKVAARRPFRHGAVRNAKSSPMDPDDAQIFPGSDLREP